MKDSSFDDEISEVQENPIGANEDDFEAVLLDGCLGFGLSIGNAAIILLMSIGYSADLESGSLIAILMALVAAVALRGGQLATDRLQTPAGKNIIVYGQAASFAGSLACTCAGLHTLAAVLAGVGLVATAFLYGRFLAGLARKALALVFDVVFMYTGIMLLILSQMQLWFSFATLAVAVVLSVTISLLYSRKRYHLDDLVPARESKRRSIKVKGNNHTLLLLGFMFSAALMIFFLGFSIDIAMVAIGASVGLAGILSLLLGQMDERMYKEAMKKSVAFTGALLLLPLPLLPDIGKLVVLSVYTCAISLNIIVLVNAVVETSRFDMISPIWLFGQEGSVFFAGIFLGGILFSAGSLHFGDVPGALYVTCIVAVVVAAWMQIRVNYQIYPFEPVIETKLDEEMQANIEHDGQRKTLWQQKRQLACERYGLSPREREILQILLKGRDAKYIMDTFYISQSTAKTHIYNIYRKFGIHSRQELLDFIEGMEMPCDSEQGEAGSRTDTV
ncbi:response regulator transcription factor [Raoultibacter timonensis]|uniref:response regulator transcription factor n=1 Tax=Raoultibacter timonensis TaxID=1907662 RepID=UPI0026DBCC38|nr:helix-turn-helix transcriptional regulator [Raoultibacter timonensis]